MLAFIFIHLKVFSNFLCDLFDLLLVWVYCLISTYSLIFQFSFSLTSSFLPLQSERTLCMISIFFNLLRLPLWTNVWFILKNVPCPFEKIAYSALVGLGVLYMSVWSSWPSVVQVFYFLIDPLSRCSIQHWRWDIEVAMCCYRAVYFSLRGFPGGSEGKASTCNVGDPGSIPGLGRSPGEGNGNPPQYSCLENPMDSPRGAWQATVHRVTKSRTRLSDYTFTFYFSLQSCECWLHLSGSSVIWYICLSHCYISLKNWQDYTLGNYYWINGIKVMKWGVFPVTQWWSIRLPMQETRVRSLIHPGRSCMPWSN